MEQRFANISFKNKFCGTLTETIDGGTLFAYDQAWTETIACCFSITRREYQWAQGLHPFFQHLGAEGWLREQQALITHTSEEDDLGLLLRYGSDCIGAVSIQSKQEISSPISIEEITTNPGRTVSGVQKKLLVTKDDSTNVFIPALASGAAPYIAKFNSASIPTLVRNEALSLHWTSAVLGKEEVNEFTLSNIPTLNETALIVTRFDKTPDGEKLRLEDCAQILGKPKGRDYSGKYDAAYEDIAEIISKHSSRSTIDLSRFFRRLIAFALIGNCDAHLKNFSLLETATGLRLSPTYDVLNTVIYPGYNQDLALSICGKKVAFDEIDQRFLIKFGQEIGLSIKIIDQIFIDIKRHVQKAAPIIKPPAAEDPDGFITRFEEIVRNACLRILP
jgi:serine/threonine-protein kinase HipA